MELTVLENIQKLTWNFEEVKAKLTADIEKYAGLVVSETNLADMEKTQKEIGKLRTTLQKFRLAVKKDLEKPYNAFELQVKELASLIESAEKPIKDQIQKYEDQRRANLAIEVQQMIYEVSEELGLGETYRNQIVVADQYLNRTQKKKDTKEDIQTKVCWFLDVQAKDYAEAANLTEKINMAKMMCELLGRDLITPYSFTDVENKIESLNITELRTYIENQVAVRKEREETAAKVALEREEQKRIAELQRQEKIAEAHAKQLAHIAEMEHKDREAKMISYGEPTSVKPLKPIIKLYNGHFDLYDLENEDIAIIKKFFTDREFNFKYSVKEAE